jgi:acetyl esterase/lipase/ketosteroid isomerase-like protein
MTEGERQFMDYVRSATAYVAPGSAAVEVRKGIHYSTTDDQRLLADIYLPPGAATNERFPVVFFLHGGLGPDIPILPREWGPYAAWGRNVAANGMVGVMFNHRLGFPEPHYDQAADDVRSAVRYVEAHAQELHADPSRICLASYSAGGPLLSLALRGDIAGVRCLVAFYSILDVRKSGLPIKNETPANLQAFSPITYLTRPNLPPLFVARAGRDEVPRLNEALDHFVAEALRNDVDIIFMNHATGEHGFDAASDERSSEIVRMALEFMKQRLGAGDGTSRDQSLSQTLLNIEQQRRDAIAAKNFAKLEAIYAPDFSAIFGSGVRFDRAALFDIFRNDDATLRFSTDDLQVRDLGEVALVTGRLTGRKGTEIVTQQRFTHIYQRRAGAWEIVAAEGTPVRTFESVP